ncbi:MAG: hypothetical protein GYB36_01950 [Alphaproteobacteria bacterium]|nr:hypothetical protein [Alphaproteobacteria bacterium]
MLLAACGNDVVTPQFIAEGNPPLLSDWGQIDIRDGELSLPGSVMPYDLNTPLFTDYAQKLRTIWMPEGMMAAYREDEVLDFPIGTVITKTFYYPLSGDEAGSVMRHGTDAASFSDGSLDLSAVRLIETRILVHREDGWAAIPYRWNDDQSEARLQRTGSIIPLTLVAEGLEDEAFNYVMPNVNQCASCHAPDSNSRAISPIGPRARHLNRDFGFEDGTANQLDAMVAHSMLSDLPQTVSWPRNAVWDDESEALNDRARAYLDINCSHCHSPVGPADTSGLFLEPDTPVGPQLGLCKLPIAAGRGTGNRPYDIVPGHPDQSIFIYRMDSTEPDVMMPEIGRSTVHHEGVELIRAWIESLDGDCGTEL